MKNIVLAAALALIAVPALAVGPQSFTVDVSRGYAVTAPCNGASCSQDQARSNWAPRGQQAQQEAAAATSSEEGANATSTRRPSATKASGKPRRARAAAQAPAHAPATPATAPASKPAGQH